MKKLASLFLVLALCLSLTVPASASIHDFYIYDADGETIDPDDVPGLSFTDGGTVLNGVNGIDLTLGSSPTIILAPGSKNTLLRLIGGDSDYTNDMTIKGTGELILYSPKPLSFGQGYGSFFGLITSLKLEDGLVMTGGAKEGDSSPLSVQAVEKNPVNGFITYSCCTADGTRAQYVRIAPKAAEKPAEPQKPAEKPAEPSSTGFSDVPDTHYAAAAIKDCVAKGITSGYADGTFRPTASVTRAQFCVMIARAFCPEHLKQEETAANKALGWFVPAAKTLYESGIDAGVLAATSFGEEYSSPEVMNRPISRYDMAQMLDNVRWCFGSGMDPEQREAAQAKIADWSSIPEIYRSAVASCYALGVIGGQSDGTFGGNNTMNRAQACVVIQRMSRYIDSNTPAETSKAPEKAPETPEKTPETPAETPAPSGTDLESMRQGVLELVNAARAQNGKSPLTLNDSLCGVAQLRAEEIVKSFSHTRPNGTSCFTAIQEAGIRAGAMGENIAAGQSSPASVMDSWMNSEGHRANILSGDFSSIGIGYVNSGSGYGHYWVQMFMG